MLFEEMFQVVERELSQELPRRWAHVQRVARQAGSLGRVVRADLDILQAAAIAHDIGYAPRLSTTGFHPLDGAVFLQGINAPRGLVNLVAHHSCARIEARLRGLDAQLQPFVDEEGPVRDALWYCDLTTSPDGTPTNPTVRLAEIQHRYGPGHIVTKFVDEARGNLLEAVDRTEDRLASTA